MSPDPPLRKLAIYFLEQSYSGLWDTDTKGEVEVLSCKQMFGFKDTGSWRNTPGRKLEVWEKQILSKRYTVSNIRESLTNHVVMKFSSLNSF